MGDARDGPTDRVVPLPPAADLRLNRDPPILSLKPDVPGNNAKRGRDVQAPADLVESLTDLKPFHRRARHRSLFDISRQWVSKSMKGAAAANRRGGGPVQNWTACCR